MDWYYAAGRERKGPVNEDEFRGLVRQGVVTSQTLVWCEGMASWQSHGSLTQASGPLEPGTEEVICATCGRRLPESEVFSLAGASHCGACKPQVLQRIASGLLPVTGAAEEVRNAHISHEASVKSVGTLYFLGGVAMFCIGVGLIVAGGTGADAVESIIGGVFLLALGVGQFWTAIGLRRLQRWARIPTGILAGIGLLGFPIGTIINGYILHLIFSKKGTTVFSEEYQNVIRQTPHIKYRTSIVVWIVLGLLVLIFAGVIVSLVLK